MKTEIGKYKVENMLSYKGTNNYVPNQFVITIDTDKGRKRIFQSYDKTIAVKSENGNVTLDTNNWDYSATTLHYLNNFLCESVKEIRKKIRNGEYKFANLN